MKHVFILNPKAGKSKAEKDILPVALEASKAYGVDYSIHRTTNVGEATSFVRRVLLEHPDEKFRFYAIGGDGTICEVASGLVNMPNCELAVIPAGSGNDFVRNFGDTKHFLDIEDQFNGTVHKIDCIQVNDKICMNILNIGLDCSTVATQQIVNQTTPVHGAMSYIVALAKEFSVYNGVSLRAQFDDGTEAEGDFLLLALGNGAYYGGGFKSCAKALLTDGLMDICFVNKISKGKFLSLVVDYHQGTHVDNPKAKDSIIYRKVSHIHLALKEEMPVCIDGEITRMKDLDVSVLRNSVRFVVPRGCSIGYPLLNE